MKVQILFLIATILAIDALPADFDIDALKQCLKRDLDVVDYTFAYKSDCSLYYLCDGDDPKVYACQVGLHYNKELAICDTPANAGCRELHSIIPIFDSGSKSDKSSGCSDGSSSSSSSSSGSSSCSDDSSSSSSSSESSGCSDESSSSSSSSESSGCSESKSCSDSSSGDCSDATPTTTGHPTRTTRTTPRTTTPTTTPSTPPTTTPTSTPITPPTTTPTTTPWTGTCPPNNEFPMYLPHADCHKFYQCDWGNLVEHQCPLDANGNRLVFNPVSNVCDWYDSAIAAGAVCPSTATTPSTTTPSVSPSTDPTSSPKPGECPPNNEYPWYVPHPDCHKFYQCDWGKLVEHECPLDVNGNRLVFNPVLNVCDWYDAAIAAGAVC